MKIIDAEVKPAEYIADEFRERGKAMVSGGSKGNSKKGISNDVFATRRAKIINSLPLWLRAEIEKIFYLLGSGLGMEIPMFGITPYPRGVCSIITLPGGDADVDVCVLPDMSDTTTPVTVAIGGIRVQPSFDADKKISAAPVLNISVTIDCNASSLADGRKYCARLQQYMNNPTLLDKFDKKYFSYMQEKLKVT